MYLFKNAFRNISRAKAKNILTSVIIFVIGLSCCVALSIKQAAIKAQEEGMDAVNITATIGFNRQKMMEGMQSSREEMEASGEDFKEQMKQGMQNQSLTLEELQTYAKASSVKDFYYTLQLSLNASTIEKIETTSEGGFNGGRGMESMNSADFTLVGYSSYDAMSEFSEGSKEITNGEVFSLDATDECIISNELATYNDLAVGDTITFVNPNNETETYALKVMGIYEDATSSQGMMMGVDPANMIYTSNATCEVMQENSTSLNTEETNQLVAQVNGTYVLADTEAYAAFQEEVSELGLSDEYAVQSADMSAYERSLEPLNKLADYATIFLWMVLVVGGAILVVFQLLRIKERKYEIGVLSAIGMKPAKIAIQFISELFIVTMVSIVLAIGVGSVISVPITNQLLENQSITSSSFEERMPSMNGGSMNKAPNQSEEVTSFMYEVTSATDFNVILQLLGLALVLTIVSGGIATLSILRYDPLKILSNQE